VRPTTDRGATETPTFPDPRSPKHGAGSLARGPARVSVPGPLPTGASLLLLALAVPLLHHAFLIHDDGGPLPLQLDDDAFYYLTIARNIVAGAGVTFDGLSLTNGFHPLWLAVLLPFAAIAPSDDWLVATVYGLDMALWTTAVLLLAGIGRRQGALRHMVLVFPVLVWYGATWGGRGHFLFFVGLEIGLAIVLILLFLWLALACDLYGRRPRDGTLLRAGGLLGLLLLARLDAVFLAATAGLAFVATARRRGESLS